MTEIRSPDQEQAPFRTRVWASVILILSCFGVLVWRLHYLQIVQYEYYHTRAEENRIALLPVAPNRGNIVDRNGEVLARNYAAYTLEIYPGKVGDLDELIDTLSEIIPIDARDRRRFKKLYQQSRRSENVPIRTLLTDEEVARFTAQRYRFPGVDVQARLFREYPQNTTASHVVGYIGRINERDLQRIEEKNETANYRGTNYIGKTGLELSYEADLHGKTGYERVEVDAGGRVVRTLDHHAAIPGNDLVLTLDLGLQNVIETAFGDRRGALVAIEPATGGVLALVSTPTFDPSLFVDGISLGDWKALNDSPDLPLLNRAIYSTYPPGSTFKPFVGLAGLASGRRTVTQAISDPGYFSFGNHRFMDVKAGGHGWVDLHKSIVVSCNTYYYQLASEMGIESLSRFLAPFGFGTRTGIDIPGEAEGVLPSPAWKKLRFRKPEQQRWYSGETISVGIGQGYNAYTPLQMAHGLSTLLNGGVMYRPHVVRHVINATNGQVRMIEPEPIAHLPLNKAHVDAVIQGMVDVNTAGTGARTFAGATYTSGGKTGTAQVFSLKGQKYEEGKVRERLRDHSWYIGFAPAENPKIALAVLVENGGFGSRAAAPIARVAFDYYLLGKQTVQPTAEDDTAQDSH
jgi:penicillin-binding protein 2